MHIAKTPKGPAVKESVPKTRTNHGVPVPTERSMKRDAETSRPHPPSGQPLPSPGSKTGGKKAALD